MGRLQELREREKRAEAAFRQRMRERRLAAQLRWQEDADIRDAEEQEARVGGVDGWISIPRK